MSYRVQGEGVLSEMAHWPLRRLLCVCRLLSDSSDRLTISFDPRPIARASASTIPPKRMPKGQLHNRAGDPDMFKRHRYGEHDHQPFYPQLSNRAYCRFMFTAPISTLRARKRATTVPTSSSRMAVTMRVR